MVSRVARAVKKGGSGGREQVDVTLDKLVQAIKKDIPKQLHVSKHTVGRPLAGPA